MPTTDQARCTACGYLPGRCDCPGGPVLPAPPAPPAPPRGLLDGFPDPMTVAEVASLFRADPKTVCRWDRKWPEGTVIRTPGGHRRFRKAGIEAVLNGRQR